MCGCVHVCGRVCAAPVGRQGQRRRPGHSAGAAAQQLSQWHHWHQQPSGTVHSRQRQQAAPPPYPLTHTHTHTRHASSANPRKRAPAAHPSTPADSSRPAVAMAAPAFASCALSAARAPRSPSSPAMPAAGSCASAAAAGSGGAAGEGWGCGPGAPPPPPPAPALLVPLPLAALATAASASATARCASCSARDRSESSQLGGGWCLRRPRGAAAAGQLHLSAGTPQAGGAQCPAGPVPQPAARHRATHPAAAAPCSRSSSCSAL
jgi:hypothetical protein